VKFKGIIFDLDQTLVDSSTLELMRTNRQWSKVLQSLNSIQFNPKLINLLKNFTDSGVQIGIITNSPGMYATGVLKHFNISFNHLIAYHDVKKRKPDPEPFIKMISNFNIKPEHCISVGDHDNDIIASQAANVLAIGAQWHTPNYEFTTNPDFVFKNVDQFEKFINS